MLASPNRFFFLQKAKSKIFLFFYENPFLFLLIAHYFPMFQPPSLLKLLVIDLINSAKSTNDAKSRLFQLEQVREILLYRETALIPEFTNDVFDFALDKSNLIRKFLIKFGGELLLLNFDSAISPVLELYKFFISDSNDGIVIEILKSLTSKYSKFCLSISSSKLKEVNLIWSTFRSIVNRSLDFIASNRSEDLRENCMHLLEKIVLFGIPAASTIADPRLTRKLNDPRLNRGTKEAPTSISDSAEEIPLHHPFISRADLQKEAEDWFLKICVWLNKGGPQGVPFTPHLNAILGQIIASIGSVRPSMGTAAAQSISFLITGKQNVVSLMTKTDRENLVRGSHRLLRTAAVLTSDPEGQMQKLKSSVAALESIGAIAEEPSSLAGKKRDFEDFEELDENLEKKKIRIADAIEKAEISKKMQLSTVEDISSRPTQTSLVQSVAVTEFTELASYLLSRDMSLMSNSSSISSVKSFADSFQSFFEPCSTNILFYNGCTNSVVFQVLDRIEEAFMVSVTPF
jgi:hypothetical protein